jgi:hypothetical protein
LTEILNPSQRRKQPSESIEKENEWMPYRMAAIPMIIMVPVREWITFIVTVVVYTSDRLPILHAVYEFGMDIDKKQNRRYQKQIDS